MAFVREWLGLPAAASEQAADVARMIVQLHWLMLVVFLGWLTYFAYVLIRFRQRPGRRRSGKGVRPGLAAGLVAVVTIWELVELVGFALPAWSRRVNALPEPTRATVVRVVAEQFEWNIHYPGEDGRFGRTSPDLISPDNPLGLDPTDPLAQDDLTTVNELNLPAGAPVLIELSSMDVIHSFTLPEMGVKQDAMPGATAWVWFQPSQLTPADSAWEMSCSQLCGLGHYRMRGLYRIMSRAVFDAWMEEERSLLAPS